MKWLRVYDPESGYLRYVTSDSVEMILPYSQQFCFVTLKTRAQQWRVKMSADRLMEWIGE